MKTWLMFTSAARILPLAPWKAIEDSFCAGLDAFCVWTVTRMVYGNPFEPWLSNYGSLSSTLVVSTFSRSSFSLRHKASQLDLSTLGLVREQ